MCGIAGIIAKGKKSEDEIRKDLARFKNSLFHRGPDEDGEYLRENAGFVHMRLSIVDIAGGRQPIFNDNGTIGIIYNGEVYNYAALKEDLMRKGYAFHTKSDTEVILKAYEEYGTDSFEKLSGMFSFCIWDNSKDVIYLVRDPFGIKPLYVYEDGRQFIFASELKAILAIPDADLSLDPAGFQDYLVFRYVQAPFTFFSRVRRLEAGTYLRIKNGEAAQFRFWDISYGYPYPKPGLEEVKKELVKKLEDSVASQLMGEVPIGVLLSGGVDSSAIAYFIHKKGANLKTFSIGFPEVNEFEYSRSVAEKYGLKHIEVLTTIDEMVANLDAVVLALDEPIADPACLPLYILSAELKKHVTVVLSGEGGDELFGGYSQYLNILNDNLPYQKRFESFLDRSWYFRNQADFLANRLPAHNLRYRKYFDDQPVLNGMLAYDLKTWMPDNLMMKADKIMMAHSLEGRFPFLDRELFNYVSALPQEFKISPQGVTKWILKEVMAPNLPPNIIGRPKMGFTVPVAKLVERLKPLISEVFAGADKSCVAEVLNAAFLKGMPGMYYNKKNTPELQLWTLFVMLYWFQFALPEYRKGARLLPSRTNSSGKAVGT